MAGADQNNSASLGFKIGRPGGIFNHNTMSAEDARQFITFITCFVAACIAGFIGISIWQFFQPDNDDDEP